LTFQQDAGGGRAAGSGGSGWLYSALAASQVNSGSTVIVNFTSGTIATVGVLMYVEGADQTTWKDVSTQNASGSGNWDTGTTATRGQANEISIAMAFDAAASASSSTTDSPATELAETSFAGDFVVPTSYQQHTSTGTSRITGVWTGGGAWCAAIATYKEAAGGNPPVDLSADAGASTAGGSATPLAFAYTAATGTSTAAGGTTALTVVLAAASGSATAGGGSVNFSGGAPVNLSATAGTATAVGGAVSPTVVYTAASGAATASGNAPGLTWRWTAATGDATAGGGDVSRLSVVADPYPMVLRFTESHPTLQHTEGAVLRFTEQDPLIS
jgi:hypothetical protein